MLDKKNSSLIALILVLCISSAACTPGQLSGTVATLDTMATAAAGVVIGCTAAEGLPSVAPYMVACVSFGELLAKGASAAATELASNDSAAVKADEIAADLAAALQATPGVVPAGTPANVVAIVSVATTALNTFLKTLVPGTPVASISRQQLARAIAARPNLAAKLTFSDKRKLRHARNEAGAAISAAKAWRAKHQS